MTVYLGINVDYSRDSLFDDLGLKRLKESYMKNDEDSPQQRFAFVSKAFSSNDEHAQRLYDYSSKHWLSYSTPILSFGRTKYGLPISCFLSWIPDTAKGLVDTLSETNWLSMLGGGVGLGFGIRSASDKSTGVMPHLKTYDASSLAYKQGNTRRGSYAAYLDISHPDILIFMEMRKPTGDQNVRCLNMHHGINICNKFMSIIERCMLDPKADDSWELKDPNDGKVKEVVSAKELWQKIIELRVQTGEPYIHFIDTSNENMPQFLKDKGLKIRQSNLCVSGDQRVPTNFGMLTAKELYDLGEDLTLASNNGLVASTSMKLIEKDAETFKITLENGITHTVTRYHKVLSKKGKKEQPVAIEHLTVGDLVAVQTAEGIFGSSDMRKEAYIHGSYDGMNSDIPSWIWSGTKETQWEYINGLLRSSGSFSKTKSNDSKIKISINHKNEQYISNIQLILSNIGIQSYVKKIDRKDTCNYSLVIGNKNDVLKINHFTGFLDDKSIKLEDVEYRDNKKKFFKIKSIESVGKQDVYCVGVKTEEHLWVCNGVITHNCSEILLPTSEDRTAVCCLSSLNIEKYDEWQDHPKFLRDVSEMLDNVLTYFINNAPDEINRAKYSAMMERSIGVGALGFHAYLQKHNIPFESAIAKSFNMRIFRSIKSGLELASAELAAERGEAPDAAGTGKRFSHLSAIAPNASSSILMGNTSPSIEPFKANCYRQDTLSGSFMNKNKYLDLIIKEKCEKDDSLSYQDIWSSIISNGGSVQHLSILDDWQKSVFKTAIEIDQRWIIEHASDRQTFIDQGQSVNLFFKPDANIKYLHAVHFMAWKKNLRTLYYCRSEKIIKTDKISQKVERKIIEEIDLKQLTEGTECLACEG